MIKLLLLLSTTFICSCTNSNHLTKSNKNKTNTEIAKSNKLTCKKHQQTGSRMNSRSCISKEQKERERRNSIDALKNATNGSSKVQPESTNF